MLLLNQTVVKRQNRRDYLIAYALASIANLLIAIPQYTTVERILSLNIPLPSSSFVGFLIQNYGQVLGVEVGVLISLLSFQMIAGVLLYLTSWTGSQSNWRWKYIVSSMSLIVYIAYALGIGYFTSLGWASMLYGSSVDVSSILQSFYLFNLVAAMCYLGLVLAVRRAYTRLSAEEAATFTVVGQNSLIVS